MPQDDPKGLDHPHRFQRQGFSLEKTARFFFASNAGLTLVILCLIIIFLLKEGMGFFPGYQRELEVYRKAGLEFVDISRKNLTGHEQLSSLLNRAYFAEVNGLSGRELVRTQEANAIFNAFTEQVGPTRDLLVSKTQSEMSLSPQALKTLTDRYNSEKNKALSSLPESPHLNASERSSLIESIRALSTDSQDEPPLVAILANEYTAAQEKNSQPYLDLRASIDAFDEAGSDLSSLVSEMGQKVIVTKDALRKADILGKESNDKPDLNTAMKLLMENKPACITAQAALVSTISDLSPKLQAKFTQPEAARILKIFHSAMPLLISDLKEAPAKLSSWSPEQPVALSQAIISFFTGKDWITGGEWQDFYGILPLAIGSLMISIVALSLAIPIGLAAAIYVNQFASAREQNLIKPLIEFIQAIPSVVLGFIGILVFGTLLRDFSMSESLSWIPGFPIEERLNIFTAGCLLALMSIPTIFSLSEDALNNVPAVYAEASEALGASRIQTTFRVIVPAAFSGILAAILLGFGRVIGETMVVLLVAGNRIKIPDFTEGLGSIFQPTHTLTGIIAQELGEVPLGSVHYRALFVVGILLFAVVLIINATAHRFVSKMKH